MYNPFPLLNDSVIRDQLEKGKRYFVRQTFKRGHVDGIKAAFLFRGYDKDERLTAMAHMECVNTDRNAFLYDAENPDELVRIYAASKQPKGYRIYYVGKIKIEWKPPKVYENKIRSYIKKKHSDWRTRKGEDPVEIGLYEEFGELFLKFNFRGDEDYIPFDEIEKY
ncbi:MAG: hypothetical protein ABUT20_23435 [Bacteroidota bacterium]